MARRPNYNFERREREKARAEKKAKRQELKQQRSDERKDVDAGTDGTAPDDANEPSSDKQD